MTVEDLIVRGAALFGVRRAEITGSARPAYVTRARFAVAWATSRGLGRSSVEIGRALGRRDHSTILHAIARAEQMRSADEDFRRRSDVLLAACNTEEGADDE